MVDKNITQPEGDFTNDEHLNLDLPKDGEPGILLDDLEPRDGSPSSESMPHYFSQDHEVTRWLINQIRCRNGLHYLVNVVNSKPELLSSYFEILDQPNLYSEARSSTETPAYHPKATLYLTPLCIAIYFKLRSVLRLLLDTSGTRINLSSRRQVDINAVCYIKRNKPRPGGLTFFDEYCTTHASVLAVRREFFGGVGLLMNAGYHPQEPFIISEHLGTTRQTNIHYSDIFEYAIRLLTIRPGIDVMNLLQVISCRMVLPMPRGKRMPFYDLNVYEVHGTNIMPDSCSPGDSPFPEATQATTEIWCSIFRRIVRRGAAKGFTNCGSRLLSVLEELVSCGFFRQPAMVLGVRPMSTGKQKVSSFAGRKLDSNDIMQLPDFERQIAMNHIGLDRDACIAYLIVWVVRVRNKCLVKQRERLLRLLTIVLSDTQLLDDFLHPPKNLDTNQWLWPKWLGQIDPEYMPPGFSVYMSSGGGTDESMFGQDNPSDIEALANAMPKTKIELPHLNKLRDEVGSFASAMNFVSNAKGQPSKFIYDNSSRANQASTRHGSEEQMCNTTSPTSPPTGFPDYPNERRGTNKYQRQKLDFTKSGYPSQAQPYHRSDEQQRAGNVFDAVQQSINRHSRNGYSSMEQEHDYHTDSSHRQQEEREQFAGNQRMRNQLPPQHGASDYQDNSPALFSPRQLYPSRSSADARSASNSHPIKQPMSTINNPMGSREQELDANSPEMYYRGMNAGGCRKEMPMSPSKTSEMQYMGNPKRPMEAKMATGHSMTAGRAPSANCNNSSHVMRTEHFRPTYDTAARRSSSVSGEAAEGEYSEAPSQARYRSEQQQVNYHNHYRGRAKLTIQQRRYQTGPVEPSRQYPKNYRQQGIQTTAKQAYFAY